MSSPAGRRGVAELDAVIEAALRDSGLAHEHPAAGRWLVDLPGTKKLKTVCGLILGEHALRVEAFVCRQPDENRERLWTYLLRRNARMYGVAYSIDPVGDVYLTGRLPHAAVTAAALADRAREAFVGAMHVTAVGTAVASLVAAVVVLVWLPGRRTP